jgi:hypothetical protein
MRGEWVVGMSLASKIIGSVCVVLTVILWIVTLATEPAPGPISAAVAMTAIVAALGILSLRS